MWSGAGKFVSVTAVVLLGAGFHVAGAAAQTEGSEATCAGDLGTTGDEVSDSLFATIEEVAGASASVFFAIEATDAFDPGWLDRSDVAEAVEALRTEVQEMKQVARSILESRGWVLDESETDSPQFQWRPPPEDLPINPTLSLVSGEIWDADAAFEQNFEALAQLSDRDSVIQFWTQGGSPCGTADSLVDFARAIDAVALVPTQELAATGTEHVRFLVFGLTLVCAGVITVVAQRRLSVT